MSYILDALKKAERERQFAKIPTVNTVHRSSWDRRRPIWLWIAGAAVLANAAILIWLLRPEPAREQATPPAPVASAPITATVPEKAPAPVEEPAAASQTSRAVVTETAPPAAPSADRPAMKDRPAVAPREPRPEASPEPSPKRVESKTTPAARVAAPP